MEPEAASAAGQPLAWFYVHSTTKESAGPVDAYRLAGLLDSAVLTPDSLVWAEGQAEWKPLKDIAELYAQVYYISSSGASIRPEATGVQNAATAAVDLATASTTQTPASAQSQPPAAVIASKSVKTQAAAPSQPDSQLAEFQAEMAALGEDVGPPVAGGIDGAAERVETPPPEDQEFEDDDGTVYVWDRKLRKFQPKGAGVAAAVPAPDYGMEEMTFAAEEEMIPAFQPPAQESDGEAAGLSGSSDSEQEERDTGAAGRGRGTAAAAEAAGPRDPAHAGRGRGRGRQAAKRRGAEEVFERIADKQKKAKQQQEAQKQWFDLKVNTSVYVSGLPDDITEAQLAERFASYGVLKPGDDGAPRVKLYRDKATQAAKGDGLVTFLYEPSVELACKLADDDYFRPGMAWKMRVQPAKFEMHGSEYVPKKKGGKKKNSKDRAKLADKVLGWGGFDDKLKPTQVTVVLKNLFHPDDFTEEPTLLKDLEADIREECAKLGQVDKVRVFAANPQGVVSVKFKAEDPARGCVEKMNGRYFGGRRVEAGMWDGYTSYHVNDQETPEQQAARLERFAAAIEAQAAAVELAEVREREAGGEPEPQEASGA